MGVTEAPANALLDLLLGTPGVLGSQVEVALSTTDPATSLSEPNVGGYARALVDNSTGVWPGASGAIKTNGQALLFPQASADYPEVRWAAVLSGGNLIVHGPLNAPVTVTTGSTPRFPAGSLSLTLA